MLPYQMPMTAAVAPEFAKRFPEAAIIFDNLHSMHDVVSDILANPSVPRDRKRAEIVRAGRLFRDDTSYVMPVPAWLVMSREMGVENMGGTAVNFALELPTPTVTRGAVMQHNRQTGQMTGMKVGQATGGAHAGMNHGTPARTDSTAKPVPADEHAGHDMTPPKPVAPAPAAGHEGHTMPTTRVDSATKQPAAGMDSMHAMHHPAAAASAQRLLTLQRALLRDPLIRRRIAADANLRRLLLESGEGLDAAERAELRRLLTPPRARR